MVKKLKLIFFFIGNQGLTQNINVGGQSKLCRNLGGSGGMLPQNFENLDVNVLNFSQIFTVIPLNMDYLITELGIN